MLEKIGKPQELPEDYESLKQRIRELESEMASLKIIIMELKEKAHDLEKLDKQVFWLAIATAAAFILNIFF